MSRHIDELLMDALENDNFSEITEYLGHFEHAAFLERRKRVEREWTEAVECCDEQRPFREFAINWLEQNFGK